MFLFFLEVGEKHLKGVSSVHLSSLPGNPGGCVLTGHAPSLWSCHLWVWPQAPLALKMALNLRFHWWVCGGKTDCNSPQLLQLGASLSRPQGSNLLLHTEAEPSL